MDGQRISEPSKVDVLAQQALQKYVESHPASSAERISLRHIVRLEEAEQEITDILMRMQEAPLSARDQSDLRRQEIAAELALADISNSLSMPGYKDSRSKGLELLSNLREEIQQKGLIVNYVKIAKNMLHQAI